ncbi:MAG: terminase small subunit [Bacteriovoracaceae bacterium]
MDEQIGNELEVSDKSLQVRFDLLTEKARLFVEEYLVDFDSHRAAKVAGYKSPATAGRKLLSNKTISDLIGEAASNRKKILQVDQFYLVEMLKMIINSDYIEWAGDISNDPETAIQNMPDHIRKMVTSFDVGISPKGFKSYKLKFMSKDRALELLGKYLGAFSDKSDVNLTIESIASEITKARKRVDDLR